MRSFASVSVLLAFAVLATISPALADRTSTVKTPVFSVATVDESQTEPGGGDYGSHVYIDHRAYSAVIFALADKESVGLDSLRKGVSKVTTDHFNISKSSHWTLVNFGKYPGAIQRCLGTTPKGTQIAVFNCVFWIGDQPFAAFFVTPESNGNFFATKLIPAQLATIDVIAAAGADQTGTESGALLRSISVPRTREVVDIPKVKSVDGSSFK